MSQIKAVGPAISGLPEADRNIEQVLATFDLYRYVPQFYQADSLGVVGFIECDEITLEPDEVTFTLPEIMEFWFTSFTGAEPSLSFQDLVKGVSCAAVMVKPSEYEKIKLMIQQLSEKVFEGAGMPMLDASFEGAVRECHRVIFSNNEPLSFRPLMAFAVGAYWLLGFIKDPLEKHGKSSPFDFVNNMVLHYARLGYTPQ